MKRRKKKAKKAKCHCRKAARLSNMRLSTLRTHAVKVSKAIEKKLSHVGVVRRHKAA